MADYQKKLCERAILKIESKKHAYEEKYGVKPQFVKVPDWLPYDIDIIFEKVSIYDIDRIKERPLCGLKVCSTISIQSIDEIEVF